ncbi:MAG: hypothetical protein JW748_05545 [Anaerolineales bacterium]|nr:hypothetical protein [Anaerolineales bacterium]
MHTQKGKRRLYSVIIVSILAALSCTFPVGTETPSTLTVTSPASTESATPTVSAAAPTEPGPIHTVAPSPTPTQTPVPPTPTFDFSGWLAVVGTWSGCVDDPAPGVPYPAAHCTAPSGNFVTLWIKNTCVIGEYCGNYVKARFESEFILLKLTLLGIQGPVVWMHGESSAMYPDATTDVAIQREGNTVKVTEKAGHREILVLPRGCDSVIVGNTGIGCFDYLA